MFKAKIDTSSIRRLSDEALNALNKALNNAELQSELGQAVIDDIKGVTRSGKSVVTGQTFPRLSDSWIETRKKIISYQGAPSYVMASKSNLSLSGQLLDSLRYRKTGASVHNFTLSFFFEGARKPYQYIGSRGLVTLKPSVDNEELAKILDERFKFIGLRDKLQSRLVTKVIDYLRVTLSKLNRGG